MGRNRAGSGDLFPKKGPSSAGHRFKRQDFLPELGAHLGRGTTFMKHSSLACRARSCKRKAGSGSFGCTWAAWHTTRGEKIVVGRQRKKNWAEKKEKKTIVPKKKKKRD